MCALGKISPRIVASKIRLMDGHDTYVSELDQAKFPQGVDHFSANFIGDVQLHHAHMSGAKGSITRWSHLVDDSAPAAVQKERKVPVC